MCGNLVKLGEMEVRSMRFNVISLPCERPDGECHSNCNFCHFVTYSYFLLADNVLFSTKMSKKKSIS